MLPNGPPRQRIATVAITRRINYHNHNLSQEQKFHAGGAINRSKVMCNTTICIRSLLYLKELRHKMSSQSRSFAAAHEYLSITTPQNRTVGMPNKERPVGRVCVAPRPSVGGGGGEKAAGEEADRPAGHLPRYRVVTAEQDPAAGSDRISSPLPSVGKASRLPDRGWRIRRK